MSTFQPPRPWIASYAAGVPEDLSPVDGSLVDIVAASARDYPDAPALQFFGRETTYAQLQSAIERAAAGLRDLGVRKMRLLTNNPKKIIGLEGYGLEVVDRLPIEIRGEEENRKYLRTKRDKMGHILELYGEMPMGCVTRDP